MVLTEAEFRAVATSLKSPDVPAWCTSDASTTFFENENGETCCVVSIKGWEGRNPIEVAGLLVHEAVHVWQAYCRDIGERQPGDEQEAYAVQSIAQELLAEFARRMELS